LTLGAGAGLAPERTAPARETGRVADGPPGPSPRQEWLAALARHHDIKAELVPLIASWRAAGIESLLYKGFFLSEFVYPAPGQRFHGDVDVLIRREHKRAALEIARRLGFEERWNFNAPTHRRYHGLAMLYRPRGATELDIHWAVTSRVIGRRAVQLRLTDAFWAHSELRQWEGTFVRTPSAVDAVLFGLVLDRCVGEGFVGFKPYDAKDLELLMERAGATEDALRRRANELGISRTAGLALALLRAGRTRTTAWVRLRGCAVGLVECGFVRTPRLLLRLMRGPRLAWDVLVAIPTILQARRLLRSAGDVRDVLRALTPESPPTARGSRLARWRSARAIRWAFRLLPFGPRRGVCLPRSLAVYATLRRQGWPVQFVSGVRRGASGLEGHAWVEEDGLPIPEMVRPGTVPDFQANFRYPSS